MKTEHSIKTLVKYSTLSVLVISNPLFAIERPIPAAQPTEKIAPAIPVEQNQQEFIAGEAIPIPEADVQETAFLGVFGESISDTLSTHLDLPKGVGIELEVVAPNSPAAKAGLQKQDIITKLAGKDISSLQDLQDAIADQKPGDEVTLNYISKGKAISKKLTLGARSVPRAEIPRAKQMRQNNQQPQAKSEDMALPEDFLNKFPQKDRKKLMQLFKGRLQGLDLQELQQGMGKLDGFNFHLLPKGLNPKMNKGLKIKGDFRSRIKMLDQHGSITLESTKDGKVIELLDKDGNLQYRGPYNNKADKMSVPEDLRDRVDNLDIDNGNGIFKLPDIDKLGEDRMKMKMRGLNRLNEIEKELMKQFPGFGQGLQQQLQIPHNFKHLQLPDLQAANGANVFGMKIDGNSISTTRTDPQTGIRYTYKMIDKEKQVEVHSPSGELLFNGPYNSEADKASVPDEYRDFLETLEKDLPELKK